MSVGPTPSQVAAAKLKVAIADRRGRPVDPWIRGLAAEGAVAPSEVTSTGPPVDATSAGMDTSEGWEVVSSQTGSGIADVKSKWFRRRSEAVAYAKSQLAGSGVAVLVARAGRFSTDPDDLTDSQRRMIERARLHPAPITYDLLGEAERFASASDEDASDEDRSRREP